MMWIVDKGWTADAPGGGSFLAFAKVGTYVVNPPTSAWLLHSPNLATADSPDAVRWEWPEGDAGIRNWAPASPGISEEGHSIPWTRRASGCTTCSAPTRASRRARDYDGGRTNVKVDGLDAAQYAPCARSPRRPDRADGAALSLGRWTPRLLKNPRGRSPRRVAEPGATRGTSCSSTTTARRA